MSMTFEPCICKNPKYPIIKCQPSKIAYNSSWWQCVCLFARSCANVGHRLFMGSALALLPHVCVPTRKRRRSVLYLGHAVYGLCCSGDRNYVARTFVATA